MNKYLRGILMIFFIGMLCYSGYQLFSIAVGYAEGSKLYDDVAQQAVVSASSSLPASSTPAEISSAPAVSKTEKDKNAIPLSINFDALWKKNQDVVGWIYLEDTPISYPVVQSEDNEYYLRRMLDGTRNDSGTIYMDYRNDDAMTDEGTYIYGHNMKNRAMFGILPKYSEQTFYEEHPVIWYFTPDHAYRIEPIAAMVVDPTSDVYNMISMEKDELAQQVEWLVSQSDFETAVELSELEQIVTLSTCSYDYDDARYVVVGSLTMAER